jgi:hypothetical protein
MTRQDKALAGLFLAALVFFACLHACVTVQIIQGGEGVQDSPTTQVEKVQKGVEVTVQQDSVSK